MIDVINLYLCASYEKWLYFSSVTWYKLFNVNFYLYYSCVVATLDWYSKCISDFFLSQHANIYIKWRECGSRGDLAENYLRIVRRNPIKKRFNENISQVGRRKLAVVRKKGIVGMFLIWFTLIMSLLMAVVNQIFCTKLQETITRLFFGRVQFLPLTRKRPINEE